MEKEKILEDMGLTKNEIKIYFSLLELGPTTTGPIIKKTGIHTSKVYDGLERLSAKGLISHIMISKFKHFKAVDPERLLDIIEEKRKQLDEEEDDIRKIIPELKLKQEMSAGDTQAEIFKGWKGMDTAYKIMRDSLKKGDTNYVFGASEGEDVKRAELFFTRNLKALIKKKVKMNIILNESLRGKTIDDLDHPSFKLRYFLKTTPAEINISNNVILIVILAVDPTVILIKDPKVTDSFRKYFDAMWQISKE